MGRYTDKTHITREEYLQLEGIRIIAGDWNKHLQVLRDRVIKILGEKDDIGHGPDFVYSAPDTSVEQLLSNSDITAEEDE